MSDKVESSEPGGAKAQGSTVNVTFDKKGQATTIIQIKPGDTINLHNLHLDQAKIDIVGRDVIITDRTTGHKIVLPEAGLLLVSSDAPTFNFDGQDVAGADLLSHVGVVNNMTEKDFIAFGTTPVDAAPPVVDAAKEIAAANAAAAAAKIQAANATANANAAQQQILVVPTPQHSGDGDYTSPPLPEPDLLLLARQNLLGEAPPPPELPPITNPPSAPPAAPGLPTDAKAGATFFFTPSLLQLAAVDDTATTAIYYGGNGSAQAALDPSSDVQFSTQIIDESQNHSNITIYANNPNFFTNSVNTRVISITSVLPDGFTISSFTLAGLPANYIIDGQTAVNGTVTIVNPTIQPNGTIMLDLQYPNTAQPSFKLTMTEVADFTNPSGNAAIPLQTEFTLTVTKTVQTKEVDSANDYVFFDGNDEAGWVLATNLNANKILVGDANDTIFGGSGANTIIVGNGNDLIYGGELNDVINTGTGNSTIYVSHGSDTITGGGGTNTLNFSTFAGPVTLDMSVLNANGYSTLNKGNGEVDLVSGISNLVLNDSNNNVAGSIGNNSILGGAGNDTIHATLGSDTLNGGGGTNTLMYDKETVGSIINLTTGTSTGFGTDALSNFQYLVGGNAGDTITGTTGNDSILGGTGADLFYATTGTDTLNGGTGSANTLSFANATHGVNVNMNTGVATGYGTTDFSNISVIVASALGDSIVGKGTDTIYGGAGNDTINGGGNAMIYSSIGSDSLVGGGGNDTLNFSNATSGVEINLGAGTSSGYGNDTFSGFNAVLGSNNGDTITGTTGNDSIIGGSGSNMLYATLGSDTLNGGVGSTNALNFSHETKSSVIDLTAGTTTGYATDHVYNFNTVIGSTYGDTIKGTTGADSITGGGGNTYIYATLGADTLNGGVGAGHNTLSFINATSASTINLSAGTTSGWTSDQISNFTTVLGSNYADTITGSTGSDSIVGGTAANLFYSTTGNDTYNGGGGTGTDTLSFTNSAAAVTLHIDTQTSLDTSGNATSFTNIGVFVGSNHGDTIYGSANNDSVQGGTGNNLFYASLGHDTLNGGVGGVNTIDFVNSTAAVTANLATDTVSGYGTDTLTNFQNFIGSSLGNTVYGSAANNTIIGGAGRDLLYASAGSDVINGDGGIDTLNYSQMLVGQTIHLDTGTSTDTSSDQTVFTGITTFVGSNHGDTIYGSTGADSVLGGSGVNLFYASAGADTLNGGSGASNTIDYINATAAVTANLGSGTATSGTWGTTSLSNFHYYIGSNLGDTVTGTTGNDSIVGGTGSDFLIVTSGNDTYNGGGGTGTDTLSFAGMGSGMTIHVDLGTAVDSLNDAESFSNIEVFIGTNHGDTIYGSSGNDSIQGGSGPNLFYASLGTDNLNGGVGSSNTLDFLNETVGALVNLGNGTASGYGSDTFVNFTKFIGGNYGDTVTGTSGSDSITGGTGNDLFYATLGSDTYNGGGGTNTIDFINATHAVTVNLGAATPTSSGSGNDTLNNIQNVVGSNFGDTITGSSVANNIQGGTGSDLFFASLGNDTYNGGGGTDTLSYASLGGGITLHLDAGSSTDSAGDVDTFSGITTFIGTNHGDTIYGSTGNDSVLGGSVANIFYASLGVDTLDGGVGGINTLDFVNATAGMTIDVGQGTATGWANGSITNFSDFEKIIGTNHGDTINGSGNADSIIGGTGNDLIYASLGGDTLNGGSTTNGSVNTVDFANASNSVTVNLSTNLASGWGNDTLTNFQNVIGSNNGDTITGSNGVNNSIQGGSGNDLFYATTGTDTYNGGGGTDTLSFSGMQHAMTLHLDTSSATDAYGNLSTFTNITTFFGSNNGDTIYGSTGADSVVGGSGSNLFYASAGNDNLNGGLGGINTIDFANAPSAMTVNLGANSASGWGVGVDTLNSFSNVIASANGDTITGNSGNNSITGGIGADLFYASAGDDIYNGGAGQDTLNFSTMANAITLHLDTGSSSDVAGDIDKFSNVEVFVGSNHGDTIYGSTGNDSVLGGSSANLFFANSGSGHYNGGSSGASTLSFINATHAVTIDMGNGTATGWGNDTFSNIQTIDTSNKGDTVYGSTGNDIIVGGTGADYFYISAGSDTLNGGSGTVANTLDFTTATSSSIINLTLGTTSGFATDSIAGFTKVFGSNNNDTIIGSAGSDTITGGTGSDLIYATAGHDVLNGGVGAGSDTLTFAGMGSAMTVHLDTGSATDALGDAMTFTNFETFIGSNNGDTIYGSTGADSVIGGSQNNTFYASLGSDNLNGGLGGINTINFSLDTVSGVTVNLGNLTSSGWGTGVDTLNNFSIVVGSNKGDTITGNSGNNTIIGGTGSDLFYASLGNDSYNGGGFPNGGGDTLNYSQLSGSIVLHLDTNNSTDTSGDLDSFTKISTFVGTNHGDTIYGSTGNDSVLGGSTSNLFYASTGSDTLNGGIGGSNTLNFSQATASSTINLTAGTTGGFSSDHLYNFTTVIGSTHSDTITGSTGNDLIIGGGGGNTIYVSLGSDTLNGGAGGINVIDFANATAAAVVNLTTGTATGYGGSASLSSFNDVVASSHGDTITGTASNDSINGGTGSDYFYATAGHDIYNGGGGTGTDTMSFASMTIGMTIHLDTGSATDINGDITAFSNINTFIGTNQGDTIYGSAGADSVIGGTGGNLFYASAGNDNLNGGILGNNTIDFVNATTHAVINLSANTSSVTGWGSDTLTNFQNVIGSNHGDTITGTSGDNTITGGVGADLFYATLGNDVYNGGGGNDTLNYSGLSGAITLNIGSNESYDSAGDVDTFTKIAYFIGTNHGDTIYGSSSSDNVIGGSGNDYFYLSGGSDVLNGGGGSNTLDLSQVGASTNIDLTAGTTSGSSFDTLYNFTTIVGSTYGDTIKGSTGNDLILGGANSDTIIASLGSDTLNGGGGSNTLDFSAATAASNIDLTLGTTSGYATDQISGFTTVLGSSHDDTIKGSAGNDLLVGGSSGNVFIASLGNDTINGNSSGTVNAINFSAATEGVTVNLTGQTASGYGSDTLYGINEVVGSSNGDTITGSTGSDTILGGVSNDLFYATSGHDVLNGGGGIDTLSFQTDATAVTLHIDTGSATDSSGMAMTFSGISFFVGSNHGDTIYGSSGTDSVQGGSGNNFFYASIGGDVLNGGTGIGTTNTIDFVNATVGMTVNLGFNTATGWSTDTLYNFNKVIGSNKGDTITGGGGNDTLIGGTGSDLFNTSAGNDSFNGGGGTGTDTLSFLGDTNAVLLHLDTHSATDTSGATMAFTNIATFWGSNNGDTIYGSSSADSIIGGTGSDTFYASNGPDTLNGGTGATNTINFSLAPNGVTINLTLNTATGWSSGSTGDNIYNFDTVVGSNHGDTITGNGNSNLITGGTGGDLFYATLGNDTYVGGGGSDTLNYSQLGTSITLHLDTGSSVDSSGFIDTFSGVGTFVGTNHNDTIYGSSSADTVIGGSGNDYFYASAGNDNLNGGAGTNTLDLTSLSSASSIDLTLHTGTNGASSYTLNNFNIIIGSNYNDTLRGSAGNDIINGGQGNDMFYISAGQDVMTAGVGGTDILNLSGETVGSNVDLTLGSITGYAQDTISGFTVVLGSNLGDTIKGSAGNDVINGGTGADQILWSSGSDVLNGGTGSVNTLNFSAATSSVTINLLLNSASGWGGTDTLYNFNKVIGSANGDQITGSTGADTITGGVSNDTIYGSGGSDSLNGGGGTNTLSYVSSTAAVNINLTSGRATSSLGTDTINGFQIVVGALNASNTITGSSGNDTLIGGNNNDYFYITTGTDTLNGGGGNNTLDFSAANVASTINLGANLVNGYSSDAVYNFNTVIGSAYGDTITGTSGSDSIRAGGGNDYFYISNGNDSYDGGSGQTTLSFQSDSSAIMLHLDTGTSTDGTNTTSFTRISTFIGTNNNDTIYGSAASDSIQGGSGNNLFYASLSSSALASDSLNGGVGGSDTIDFALASNGVVVNLALHTATGWGTDILQNFDNIVGSNHGDTITGNTDNNYIVGGSGSDLFYATAGTDTYVGGGGNDTLNFSQMSGALTITLTTGTSTATDGTNTSYFSGVASIVDANRAGDLIYSSAGNDSVLGGTGNDYFYASTGNDTFNGAGSSHSGTNENWVDFSMVTTSNVIDLTNNTATVGTSGTIYTDHFYNVFGVIGSNNGDTITGTSQFDVIIGGSSNDVIYITGGNDSLNGGGGTNTLNLSKEGGADWVDLTAGTSSGWTADALSNFNVLIGSNNYGDTLTGSTGSDTIIGGALNDHIYSSLGSDNLNGGGGTNILDFSNLSGTAGVTVNLTTGSVTGAVTDTISNFNIYQGSNIGDNITGLTNGSDTLNGGTAFDTFNSTPGTHVMDGGGGGNAISFQNSTNAVTVSLLANTATGWGNDVLHNFDVIYGSNVGDNITGSANNDTIIGGSGNDTIFGTLGNDILNGGGNSGGTGNTLDMANATASVSINAIGTNGQMTYGGYSTSLYNFTSYIGSIYGDTVFDSTNGSSIQGGSGNDDFIISGSNDTINTGLGADVIQLNYGAGIVADGGGGGNDTLQLWGGGTFAGNAFTINLAADTMSGAGQSASFAGFSIYNLSASTAFDTIYGTTGNDTVYGGTQGGYFYASAGNDSLIGYGNNNNYIDYSNDTVGGVLATLSTGASTATVTGYGTDHLYDFNVFFGSSFNDTITGSATNDYINGEGGNNYIYGSAGIDQIIGGSGTNTLDFSNIGTNVINIDLVAGVTSGYATDNVSEITNIIGSNGNDVLRGITNSTITGGSGNDTIEVDSSGVHANAGGGNNYFIVGNGTSQVLTGNGNDTINFEWTNYGVNLTMGTGGTGSWTGNSGSGTYTGIKYVHLGNGSNDSVLGTTGNDSVWAGTGNDTFTGNGGTDTFYYSDLGGTISTSLSGAGNGTITDSSGGTSSISGVKDIVGNANAGTYTLDETALAQFTSINGGNTAGNTAVVTENGGDASIASQMSNLFSNFSTINLHALSTNSDAWGASLTGTEISNMLGGVNGGTLNLSLANGSNLANTIAFAADGTYTSTSQSGTATNYTETFSGSGHTVYLHVTLS